MPRRAKSTISQPPAPTEGAGALLAALQYGDSFFPSGAVSFSLGLETLCQDSQVAGEDAVGAFVADQLRNRWALADRGFLAAAHKAAAEGDLAGAREADQLQDAMTWPGELRDGSCRSGAALLGVHARLGTAHAEAYRADVRSENVPGHLAVVQGIVTQGAGLTLAQAEAVAAHGFYSALLGAALRLGQIGHVGAQTLLTGLRPEIAKVLERPAPALDEVSAFTPLSDVAVMRHAHQTTRLFAN